jgi:hypothetical protein
VLDRRLFRLAPHPALKSGRRLTNYSGNIVIHPSQNPRSGAATRIGRALVATGAVMLLAPALLAQIAVTEITTSSTNQSDRTVNGDTFGRETVAVTTFKDGAGNIYDANSVAGNAYVRRNTGAGNANNSSVWYADGSSTDFAATYATSYDTLLLGNNLLRGSDNTFANGTGTNTGNIERLDFLFSASGITSTIATAVAVYDRGSATEHDTVSIAVITGWANNAPTSYGGVLVTLAPANYGSTNPTSSFNYHLFRYSNGSNLDNPWWNNNSETGAQGIGGATISMVDLGIAAGTTIYGYSLMAGDVTATTIGNNMANLVDWNNTTYYSSTTDGNSGGGGIDLSAVNGVLYNKRVPEPSTYGAILLGLGAVFFGWRRYRRNLSGPEA